jgi:hypothetical protein
MENLFNFLFGKKYLEIEGELLRRKSNFSVYNFYKILIFQERRDKNMALVMQMYPDVGFNGSLSTYHGSQFI